MGPKQRIQAEANAENTSGPHDESPHGGGRRRRPPPCGEGRPKAAPHYVVRQYFQHWPPLVFPALAHIVFPALAPIVFSALAPYCIFCFGPILYSLLWPHIVLYFWAGRAKNPCFFSFPVWMLRLKVSQATP